MPKPRKGGDHRTVTNCDPRLFLGVVVRPESIPEDSDPDLLERIAEACSGGCPRRHRDVMAALLVDGMDFESNIEAAQRMGIRRQSAELSRKRGMAALRDHTDIVVALLQGRRPVVLAVA